jgi:hypothetical protein
MKNYIFKHILFNPGSFFIISNKAESIFENLSTADLTSDGNAGTKLNKLFNVLATLTNTNNFVNKYIIFLITFLLKFYTLYQTLV